VQFNQPKRELLPFGGLPFFNIGDTMNIQEAINRLSKYPLDAPVCMVLWLADDVIKQAKELGVDITSEIAAEVLESLENHHDCNYGITWETIDAALEGHLRQNQH